MSIPPDAVQWRQPMDPSDRLDYVAQFGDLLAEDETIFAIEVTPLAEAVALGLTVVEDANHGPFIADDTNVEVWLSIDPAMQSDSAFDGKTGALLPIQITIDTNASPSRRFQRTLVVQVKNL